MRGLEHAHKQIIIHRDIKPANLMINKNNQVKVADFGIARVSGASRNTRDGTIIGTYEYISPEAAQGQPATALSDLYSMGVVLFELIAGRLPFESQNEYELLGMHIHAARPSLRSMVEDAPASVDDIVQRAMDRKAGKRFGSAEEMADALQKCLATLSKRTSHGGIRRFFSRGGETARAKTPPAPALAERRRTDISSACRQAEDLLDRHLWSEAGEALDAGLRSHPDEPELVALRNRMQRQRQQYEQAVAQQAELIRDLLNRGLAEEALKVAGNALAMHPEATSLLDLQRECRERVDLVNAGAGELAQVQERVNQLIAAGGLQEATDYILELLASNPNQNELNKLLARILQAPKDAEKHAAVRQYASEAEKVANAGQFEAALAILEEALRRFPGSPISRVCGARCTIACRRNCGAGRWRR